MSAMYCTLCDRPVEGTRHIGAGTIVLAVLTAGMSLLAVPFYRKRCPICRTAAVSLRSPDGSPAAAKAGSLARLKELERRLSFAETELEAANEELGRLREERDFYRKLLEDPAAKARYRAGG